MDEVDSIGSARSDSGGGGGGGDSEVQRTMLELLNQLDGFEATNKIKVRHASCRCLVMWVMSSTIIKVSHATSGCQLLMWVMPPKNLR